MARRKKEQPAPDPSTTTEAFELMSPRWFLIDSLLGGTETMREAGSTFLPQHSREDPANYSERLERAVLVNLFELTLDFLVGKPFSDPITLNADVPPQIVEWADDIDLEGHDLNHFSQGIFRNALAKGFTHVLVDAPRSNPDILTLADERKAGNRPYFCEIAPENLFFAEAKRINGVETLTHIRFYEFDRHREGFDEIVTKYIRVLELRIVPADRPEDPGVVRMFSERWREVKDAKGKVEWVSEGSEQTDLDFIPLLTFYSVRDGFMVSKPPLLDLAYLNVEHWQSYSDQINILTVARFPILAASGVSEYDDSGMSVGPREFLKTEDPLAKFYYVEHGGAAIEAGRKHIKDLEDRMSLYGAQLLKKRPDRETATSRELDEQGSTAPLQLMALAFADTMAVALSYLANIGGVGDNGGTISIKTDFGLGEQDTVDLQTLVVAYKDGIISREAMIYELKRRGVLAEEYDEVKDAAVIAKELKDRKALTDAQTPTPAPSEGDGGGEGDSDDDGAETD